MRSLGAEPCLPVKFIPWREDMMKRLSLLYSYCQRSASPRVAEEGGGLSGSPDQPTQPVSVTLNSSSVTLDTGDTFQFQRLGSQCHRYHHHLDGERRRGRQLHSRDDVD